MISSSQRRTDKCRAAAADKPRVWTGITLRRGPVMFIAFQQRATVVLPPNRLLNRRQAEYNMDRWPSRVENEFSRQQAAFTPRIADLEPT